MTTASQIPGALPPEAAQAKHDTNIQSEPRNAQAAVPSQESAQRASYDSARAVADRLVDRLTVLPKSVDITAYNGAYTVQLYFDSRRAAGEALLSLARTADTEVHREKAASTAGDWLTFRTTVDGTPVGARVLLTKDDADKLLSKTPPGPQPMPLGTGIRAHVAAISPTPGRGGTR